MKNYYFLKWLLFCFFTFSSTWLLACPFCATDTAQLIRAGIFNQTFFINLMIMLLPYLLLLLIAFNLTHRADARPIISTGFILGVAIGGFIDGILFHQILQTHSMLSNIIYPDTLVKQDINMFWDGIFHAANLIFILIGLGLLWQVIKQDKALKSTVVFSGAIFSGMGAFNLIEGIIDHHVFQLHHVIQRAPSPIQTYWDIAFLGSGILLIVIGTYMIKNYLRLR